MAAAIVIAKHCSDPSGGKSCAAPVFGRLPRVCPEPPSPPTLPAARTVGAQNASRIRAFAGRPLQQTLRKVNSQDEAENTRPLEASGPSASGAEQNKSLQHQVEFSSRPREQLMKTGAEHPQFECRAGPSRPGLREKQQAATAAQPPPGKFREHSDPPLKKQKQLPLIFSAGIGPWRPTGGREHLDEEHRGNCKLACTACRQHPDEASSTKSASETRPLGGESPVAQQVL